MKRMRALCKIAPDKAEIQQVPVPQLTADQVLLQVSSAALCGTDLHIYHWNAWARSAGIQLPLIMGHECCGKVVAVGKNVSSLEIGDKVAVETHLPCGQCLQCSIGDQHICSNLKLFSIHTDGCFAEYTAVPEICARKIPEEISSQVGAVMEPLGTALRSVFESQVAGATVFVTGCGPIGLFAIASSSALGASRILASDISASRLKIAERMGAYRILDPNREDTVEAVLAETGGYGADVVIEASGSIPAIQQAFRCLRKGGRVALVGLPDQPLELEIGKDVVFKEAKIIGIHGRTMFDTWTRMENLLTSGKLDVLPAITHVLPLDNWQEGFDLASSGTACKVVFKP
jgi:threonine 3-dehydrogenase